jgi:hypothetical protein
VEIGDEDRTFGGGEFLLDLLGNWMCLEGVVLHSVSIFECHQRDISRESYKREKRGGGNQRQGVSAMM